MRMVKAMIDGLASGAIAGADGGFPRDAGAPSDAGAPRDAGAPSDAGVACVLASNAEHVAAGWARAYFGFAYPAGSGQSLGLTGSPLRTSLTRVATGVYVIGACR